MNLVYLFIISCVCNFVPNFLLKMFIPNFHFDQEIYLFIINMQSNYNSMTDINFIHTHDKKTQEHKKNKRNNKECENARKKKDEKDEKNKI